MHTCTEYCCEDHLIYYRFLGRVMGKALFDRQLVAGHIVGYIYKHILGWPVTFGDLAMVDDEYYNNLKQLQTLATSGEDLSMLCLDFTTTQDIMGVKEEIELIPNGAKIEVDNDNFPEYLEACLKYRMLDRVKPQLNELLLGFFDVIPEPLLTIFDFQELELLMCGLPDIDLEDWKDIQNILVNVIMLVVIIKFVFGFGRLLVNLIGKPGAIVAICDRDQWCSKSRIRRFARK